MCVQAPGAFNLSLLCALIHGGGGALCECFFFVSSALATGKCGASGFWPQSKSDSVLSMSRGIPSVQRKEGEGNQEGPLNPADKQTRTALIGFQLI